MSVGKRSDASVPLPDVPIASNYRTIGDILLPYYLLESLEIDWTILKKEDPRIKAMEDGAKATPKSPIMTPNLCFSHPCVLSTVANLHINLGTTPYLARRPEHERAAQQLDLILKQFDLPALRNFHLSCEADVPESSLENLWNEILSVIHLQRYPCLQTVQICFAATYGSYREEGNMPVWVSLEKIPALHLDLGLTLSSL